MLNRKITILITSVLLLLAGCKTVYLTEYKEVLTKDTIITVSTDTLREYIQIECDSDLVPVIIYKEVQNSDRGKINTTPSYADKTLILQSQAVIDSLELEIKKYKETEITTQTITEYVDKPVSSYYKFVSWGFWILLLLWIGYIVVKVAARFYH